MNHFKEIPIIKRENRNYLEDYKLLEQIVDCSIPTYLLRNNNSNFIGFVIEETLYTINSDFISKNKLNIFAKVCSDLIKSSYEQGKQEKTQEIRKSLEEFLNSLKIKI